MQPLRLTREQVRQVDRIAIQEYGIPGIVLMENAARNVAEQAHARLGLPPRRVLIVCGTGNNAADGYATARHLANRGHRVELLTLAPPDTLKGDARVMADIIGKMALPTHSACGVIGAIDWDAIIDAVFGTGLSWPPTGIFAEAIAAMNAVRDLRPVIAVDLPSGLDADTGLPLGDCVRAAATVTFVAEKIGFANPASHEYTGRVIVADIGAPKSLALRVAHSSADSETAGARRTDSRP